MRHSKYAGVFALIVIAAASAFAAGQAEPATGTEAAQLNVMLLGPGRQQDSERVWASFSDLLGETLPGTTVDFEVLPTSDYRERWQLTMAANERVDLAWRGWVLSLDDEVAKGAYRPLDDLVDEHAPDLLQELPGWLLDMGRVNGVLYEVPNYQQTAVRRAIWARRDLAERFLDIDAFQEMLWASDVVTDEWLDVIEDFLRDAKEAGELRLGIHVPWFEEQGYDVFANPYAYRLNDPEMRVVNIWDTPRHRATLDRLAEWYQEGYIRQDILSVQRLSQDDFRPDGHIMWMDQVFRGSVAARSADRGFEMIAFAFDPHYRILTGRTPTNMTVPRTARYPERAVQLLELLNTKRGADLYNMLVYGLEGVHYERVGDNRIETLHYVGAPTGDSPYGLPKWAVGNTFNAYLTQAEEDGWNEYIENVVHGEKARVSPIQGFVADRTTVQDEFALVDAIRREYRNLFALPDYKEVYAEYMEKLRVAGNDRIIEEFQRQIDDFRRQNR